MNFSTILYAKDEIHFDTPVMPRSGKIGEGKVKNHQRLIKMYLINVAKRVFLDNNCINLQTLADLCEVCPRTNFREIFLKNILLSNYYQISKNDALLFYLRTVPELSVEAVGLISYDLTSLKLSCKLS